MTLGRSSVLLGTAAAILLGLPGVASAQKCKGQKPKGGMWATSAELYLKNARSNPRPEEKASLYQQALDVLAEGFEKQPENPRNYEMAGQAYVGLNDYEGADSVFKKAVEIWSCYSGLIDTLRYNAWVGAFNRGIQYAGSGDEERAVEAYSQAWMIYKKLPQPQLQIGAISANRALAAEPGAERAEEQSRAQEAFRSALTSIEQAGERLTAEQRQEYSRAAAFNLAQMLAFDERYQDAAKAYDRFLALEPDNVDATTNAAVVLTRASTQNAAKAADMEDGPEKEAILADAAALKERAKGYYAKLLGREDLSADEFHNLGIGLLQLQMNADAVQAFSRAVALTPYSERSMAQLAFVLFSEGNYDSLTVVAQKLVDRYPLDKNNLALLANAYRELDNSEKALELLERREALAMEVVDVELKMVEESYELSGNLLNISLEPGATVDLVFDFYSDAGEKVSTAAISLTAAEAGMGSSFTVPTTSEQPISGFSYQVATSETPSGT